MEGSSKKPREGVYMLQPVALRKEGRKYYLRSGRKGAGHVLAIYEGDTVGEVYRRAKAFAQERRYDLSPCVKLDGPPFEYYPEGPPPLRLLEENRTSIGLRPVNIRADLHERVREEADAQETSMVNIVEEALQEWMQRYSLGARSLSEAGSGA